MVEDIKIEDFDYPLPQERIALHPLEQRDACRLLLSRGDGAVAHRHFHELPSLLPPGSILVCNDTKVINARIIFHKESGARIEVFLLEPISPSDYALNFQSRRRCVWSCMVGNLKRWKEGELHMLLSLPDSDGSIRLSARRLEALAGNSHAVEFSWDNPDASFASVLEAAGCIPIPPYLCRESELRDAEDYQTVYSVARGSVAAPTAGLHFTEAVMADLAAHNIPVEKLTLHVGAGTFQPVKSATIGHHPMHTEKFSVSLPLVRRIIAALREGRTIVAVGTTSVRTLESLPILGAHILSGSNELHVAQWEAYSPAVSSLPTIPLLEALAEYMESNEALVLPASTAIMIAPGFRWRITGAMVTNFHQPQSTLLLLVSSFLEQESPGATPRWRKLYDEALALDYRFLSYGDACLLFPLRPL